MSSIPYAHADMCPCKGCTERTAEPNCHGTCKKYLSWTQTKQEAQDRKNAIKDPERAITEGAIAYIRKCRKKRHGRK